MKKVLSTQNLAVGYPQKSGALEVLGNLDLCLFAGELVCFMGPNGIGKSTLMRTMAGLQAPLEGRVNIGDQNLKTMKPNEKARMISIVLTERILAGGLTALEAIQMGRYPHTGWNMKLKGNDQEAIDRAVSLSGTKSLLNQQLYTLSDGQMQKVMIARALAQDTPIMILDEPTVHLDLDNRLEIMNLLRSLTRETQKAVLMATHELDLSLQMADKLWLAGLDKKIHTGIPEDLVLNGALDATFQMKGFDLKTGRVVHHPQPGKIIAVEGEGPLYLWTKNAVERWGFSVQDEPGVLKIKVSGNEQEYHWELFTKEEVYKMHTMEALLKHLKP